MNALELLKGDHEVVADLFEKIKATEEGEHPQIFTKIKAELDIHTHIEESIFYPKLLEEGDEELTAMVREGIEEHRQVKMFLREIDALAENSEKYEAKLKVLMEDVEHHVKEEEDEMFPMVEGQFESDVLDDLGAEMEEEKKAFKQERSASAST